MHRYMFDTDVCSYVMKRSHPPLLDRMMRTSIGEVCISVVTRAELEYGVLISPREAEQRSSLREFLPHVDVLDLPEEAVAHYAAIRADLKGRGQMIGSNDLWIAAHARLLRVTLVTNNVREFGRVPGLIVENWTE